MTKDRNVLNQMMATARQCFEKADYGASRGVFEEVLKAEDFQHYYSSTALLSISLCHAKEDNEDACKEVLFRWRAKHKNDKISDGDQALLDELD